MMSQTDKDKHYDCGTRFFEQSPAYIIITNKELESDYNMLYLMMQSEPTQMNLNN
jgi:hypothetical protein